MKKIILFILLLIPVTASAGGFEMCFHYGLGISHNYVKAVPGSVLGDIIYSDPTHFKDSDTHIDYGLSVGGYFLYYISDIAILAGVYYEDKPFKIKYSKQTASSDIEYRITPQFVTLPFGIRYYTDLLFFGAGGYFSNGFNESKAEEYQFGFEADFYVNIENDAGIYFEAGTHLPMTKSYGFDIFLRYEYGLRDVGSDHFSFSFINTRVLFINAGMFITYDF